VTDIDLIPSDYRHAQWLRTWFRMMISGNSAVLIFALFVAGALTYETRGLEERARELKAEQSVTAQQRTRLEDLTRQRDELSTQLTMLRGLRSGAPAEMVFHVIDAALAHNKVWLVNWDFRRAGVLVPEQQARTVETGYFIVIPAGQQAGEREMWMVETHMSIRGQAQDHDALSRFVKGLFEQPAVVDVRVQKTAMRSYSGGDVIDFDLAIVLNSEARG
jgi:hypothetical protein